MSKEAAYAWLGNKQFIQSKILSENGRHLINDSESRPVIIAVPHIGNWEFFWHWLQLNFNAISMYSPVKMKSLNQLILAARQKFGGTPFDTSPKGILSMLKALRKQGVMMILPDQAPRLNSGIYTPFFGHPAYTMTLLHKFIQKTNAKLLIGTCLRDESKNGFNIGISEPEFESLGVSLDQFNQSLNKSLEVIIRKHPTQYLWGYKRFKRQPSGSEFYLDEIKRREKRERKLRLSQ
jgi:KDO2-lipid IV(A) lauroyltransferase